MGIWQVECDGQDAFRVAGDDWNGALAAALTALGRDPGAAASSTTRVRPDGVLVASFPTGLSLAITPAVTPSATPSAQETAAADEEASVPGFEARIAGAAGVEDAANRALTALDSVVPAESASVMLRMDDKLGFVAVRGPAAHKVRNFLIRTDAGLAGRVYTTGTPVLIDDVSGNHVHLHALAQEVGYAPRAVLVVPVVDHDGQTYGVIELLRRDGSFDAVHERAAVVTGQALGRWLAMSPEYGT